VAFKNERIIIKLLLLKYFVGKPQTDKRIILPG
jgi:hypothetical protein